MFEIQEIDFLFANGNKIKTEILFEKQNLGSYKIRYTAAFKADSSDGSPPEILYDPNKSFTDSKDAFKKILDMVGEYSSKNSTQITEINNPNLCDLIILKDQSKILKGQGISVTSTANLRP